MMELVRDGKIFIDKLQVLANRPPLFQEGDKEIWVDDHISQGLLEAHLDPEIDAASRKHETIVRSCDWLVSRLDLKEGSKVIDLGCGPGLYCEEFARLGLDVTGVDFSKRSIDYASDKNKGSIRYIHENYLTADVGQGYEAAFIIFYDFDVLSDRDRNDLLDKVYSILKEGGFFILDVLTPDHEEAGDDITKWSVNPDGDFWSSKGHLVLFRRYYYPEEKVKLDQNIIIDEDGEIRTYRIWHRFYTLKEITKLLKKHGYLVEDFYADLMGTPYVHGSSSIGLIARKIPH